MPGVQQGIGPGLPPGLLVVLSEGAGQRAAVALEIAASAAALGRPVALFLKCWPLPDLTLLLELGVDVTLCQTALAEAGGDARQLPAGIETGGLLGALAGRANWQLLLA